MVDAGSYTPCPSFRRQFLRWALCLSLLPNGLYGAAAAPPTSRGRGQIRIVVLSDFNESYGSVRYSTHFDAAVVRAIEMLPDLVISTGDTIAGQCLAPPLARSEVGAMWRSFHDRVSRPLAEAGLAFAVTPGNHDASSGHRFLLLREIYREQWGRGGRRSTSSTVMAIRSAMHSGSARRCSSRSTPPMSAICRRTTRTGCAGCWPGRGLDSAIRSSSATFGTGHSRSGARPKSWAMRNWNLSCTQAPSICTFPGITMPTARASRTASSMSARVALAPRLGHCLAPAKPAGAASPWSTSMQRAKSGSRPTAGRTSGSRSRATRCRRASNPDGRRWRVTIWPRRTTAQRVADEQRRCGRQAVKSTFRAAAPCCSGETGSRSCPGRAGRCRTDCRPTTTCESSRCSSGS